MKQPAVFLDRDGTLIEDAGFLRVVTDVDFYSQTIPALRRLSDFALFIVTNQSGIARDTSPLRKLMQSASTSCDA